MNKLTPARRDAYLAAADVCRNMQRVYRAKAKGKYRDVWNDHANGAGACAMELEILAGLNLGQIVARRATKNVRHKGGTIMDERTAMLLAAISTAAMQNTRESAKERIGNDNPCWTAAYGDVCAAVDREIDARERAEAMLDACAQFLEAEARSCLPGSAADDQNWGFCLQSAATKMRRDLIDAASTKIDKQ